jgi:hypothetical protein
MSLSITWLAAIPASLVAKGTSEQILSSTSHFFGDLLRHPQPVRPNGPSDPTPLASRVQADEPAKNWSERLLDARRKLDQLAKDTRLRLGLASSDAKRDPILIAIDAAGRIDVSGPTQLCEELARQLQDDPDLSSQLQSIARTRPDAEPSGLQNDAQEASVRLWID